MSRRPFKLDRCRENAWWGKTPNRFYLQLGVLPHQHKVGCFDDCLGVQTSNFCCRKSDGVKRPIGFTSIWASYLTSILVAKVGCFDNRLGVQTSNFCYRKSGGVKRPIGDMSRRPFSWIVARRMHGGVKRPRFYLHLGILPHQYFGGKSCMSGRPHERPDVQLLPLHW